MKTADSYQVLHWQLSQLENTPIPLTDSYITIWWKQIPLGHIWWHFKTNENLKTQVWEAIQPTINFYININCQETANYTPASISEMGTKERSFFLQKALISPQVQEQPISIVICTRNRPEDLRKCLASLLLASTNTTEIIVVDNAPADELTKLAVSSFDGVKYILENRPGLDVARNTGIKNATHHIIAFTDDDVIIPVDWITNLLSCFHDPLTMAVTGIVMPVELETKAQVIFERDWGFNKGYLPKIFDHRYYLNFKEHGAPVWDIGAGANMAFRKEVFDLVGLFDERLDVGAAGCSGDSEMWFRILAEGWNCCYFPHNYVFHKHRAHMDGLRHQLFHYMKGHACALLVQHEKYPDAGNNTRMYKRMPKYYASRVTSAIIKMKSDPFLLTEIRGFVAGHHYYRLHRNKVQPVLKNPPLSLNKYKLAGADTIVSVVIPCYNHGHFLVDAIQSVIEQTHQCWEIVVIDDGSDDNTKEVCEKFANQLKYVKVERVGLSAARNIGVSHSSGDYIIFLDADDFLYPKAIELNLFYFNYYTDAVMISGGHVRVSEKKADLPTNLNRSQLDNNYAALLRGNYIGMEGAVMYRKDLFPFFHFDTSLPACEDYDINLKIAQLYPVFGHDKILAAYRIHDKNMSSDKGKMLSCALKVLGRHKENLDSAGLKKAYKEGIENWKKFYDIGKAESAPSEERIPGSPPIIAPVDSGIDRPTWSVMIPAYNCGKYLPQTIASVLMQDKGEANMQIEVVDDASTDIDVKALVETIGQGRVSYFRQEKNLGSLRNFESCLNRAKGFYVHLLHGDDYVDDGFYLKAERLFNKFPEAGAVCTGFTEVDEAGRLIAISRLNISSEMILENWLDIITRQQILQPPAVVVKRSVYESLGGFYGVQYGEDWEMWARIAGRFQVVHSPERLAHYRVHSSNISSSSLLSGQHLHDIKTVINQIQSHLSDLPDISKRKMKIDAERNWSHYFAHTSDKTYGMYRKPKLALRQSIGAFKLHQNKTTLYYLLKTFVKYSLGLKPASRKKI